MLILRNEEIGSPLTVDLALKSLEQAYIGQARGTSVNICPACTNAACTPLKPCKVNGSCCRA